MIIITFKTSLSATKAHWKASEAGIECRLIPTPQSLGVQCGYALCADADKKEQLLEIVEGYNGVYEYCNL